MPIDWNKYGSQPSSGGGIDWGKYQPLSSSQQDVMNQEQSDFAQMDQAQQTMGEMLSRPKPYEAVDVPEGTTFDAVGPNALRINPDSLNRESLYTQPEQPKTFVTGPAMETISYGLQGLTQPIRDLGEAIPNSGFDVPKLEEPTYISPTTARIAEVGGELLGMAPGIGGAYGTTGRLATRALAKAAPNAPRLLETGVRGYGAMAGYQTGAEALDATLDTRHDGSQSITGRLKNIAVAGLGGAAGDAALSAAGRGILKGAQALRKPRESTGLPAFDEATKAVEQTQPSVVRSADEVAASGEQTANIEPVKQNWFTRLFGEQNVGFTPFGSNKSNRMVTTEQQIVNNPLKNNIEGALQSTKQAGRAGYQNAVDYLSPLKTINRETYNTAMDASRANNLANTIIRDKFVDNEGNVIGSSLNDIMKSVRGMGKKFDDYLVLRHAETRMARGERVYDDSLQMTPEKAQQAVQTMEARYPGLKSVGEEWDKFNTNMLESGVKEGLISQASRDAMREANPNYASMRRQFTIGEKLAQPKWGSGGSAFSGQKAPIKEVSPTGSTRKIVSPIRSAIEQAYAWKNAELRNRSMQEITKAIQADPAGMQGIAEIIKKPSTSYKSLDDALREGGSEEFLQQLDDDFKSLFKMSKTGEENIVRSMVQGNPVYIQVHNPEAVKALLGMGAEQSGIILGAMQKLSNATKRGATGVLAPMFAVKNLTADTVQAAIQSPNAFKHVAVDLPHALISSIGDVFKIPGMKNLADDFRRSGGEYSALLRGDRQVNRSVYQLRRVAPLTPEGIVKGAYNTGRGILKGFEKVADVTENVNRMAAFRRAMVGKERTPENVRNAINAARESTTNFSRKGALSREVEAFVPYSNAAVQGIYRITKALVKNPVKTLAGIGTLVVAPKLYEYAKFNDDPDYQKLPARERYRNIIYSKNADGTFNKMPMPPEYEAFGAFMTDVLNDVVNHDPQAYKGTLDALANALTPPLVSGALQGATQGGGVEQSLTGAANATVAAPFVATIANKSFTGAPIEPATVTDRSPQNRYDERTSAVAKKIGQYTGFSPMKTDYLIRAYGGDPARLLLPLTSQVGQGNMRNTLLKNFIVDPTLTNNLTNDFYGAKQNLTNAFKDNKEVGAPLPKWFDETLYKDLTSQAKGSISKQLSGLTDQKKQINSNISLSPQQKTDALRAIQRTMNDVYAEINTKLQQKGVPLK